MQNNSTTNNSKIQKVNMKPCTFCKKQGINPPAMGNRATGSYRVTGEWETSRPKVFNGFCCDFHADNVEWVSFNWRGK